MQDRPPLESFELDRDYSRALRKRADELGQTVSGINASWNALAERKAAFRSQDPATFDPSEGEGIVLDELRILQHDLACRKQLLALELEIQQEARSLSRSAAEKLRTERSAVEEKLLGIGFEESPPGAIDRHPGVVALAQQVETLNRRANAKEWISALNESIRTVEFRLEKVKGRILSLSV